MVGSSKFASMGTRLRNQVAVIMKFIICSNCVAIVQLIIALL